MKLQQGKGEPSFVVIPYSVCREPALDIAEKASGRQMGAVYSMQRTGVPYRQAH